MALVELSHSLRFLCVLCVSAVFCRPGIHQRRDAENAEEAQRNTSLEESIVTFNCPVKQNILNACAGSNVVYDQTFALRLG